MNFKPVENLQQYIEENGIEMKPASKFARINARPAKEGEVVHTKASDGVDETVNTAHEGDYVVNNVDNPDNTWIIQGPTFMKKYEPSDEDGVYKPKGGPMLAGQITEPISFIAPWGEQMNIDAGGYILQTPDNPNDIYGISQKDFDKTYRVDGVNENINLVKNLMERMNLNE